MKLVPDRIYCIAVHPSPDRILFSVGDKLGRIGMWDYGALDNPNPNSGTVVVYEPHSAPLSALMYSPQDAAKLVSCSYDGSVRCMDWEKEMSLELFTSHDRRTCLDVAASGQLILCGSVDGSLALIDTRDKTHKIYNSHEKKISSVNFNPSNANIFATGSSDRTLKVWDLRKVKQPLESFEHGQAVSSCGYSRGPNGGKFLVSASYDDHLRVWEDLKLSKKIKHNNNTGRWVTPFKLAFDPKCEDSYAIGGMDRGLEIFSCSSGSHKARLYEENLTAIPSINAFHPYHNIIVSATASGRAYLWQLKK